MTEETKQNFTPVITQYWNEIKNIHVRNYNKI